jgi:Flp pilus assembly protein TadG
MDMLNRIRRDLRSLRACRRGISALEFALAAPLLFLIVFGMFELALITFVLTSAEGGLREASRYGITGQQADNEAERRQQILDILGERTLGMIDMSRAEVTLRSYPSFNDVGQPEPFEDLAPLNQTYDSNEPFTDLNGNGQWDEDRGTDGVGNAGDVVLYRIDYEWDLLMPFVARILGTDGYLPMSASIVVRNECWVISGGC